MSDITLLLDIGAGAGTLPDTTPAPVRYGCWFPVPHGAMPIAPVDGSSSTPVADGVLLEWTPSDQAGVEYKIERAASASGPWTEIARVSEPRYLVSDPSGAAWHYRITPIVRGKSGAPVTVTGASKPAPSVADLVAQQTALDAEVLARTQGDLQTALDAAADAQAKADAALANASEQTDAALAQALAAANAALTTATAQTDALAAEVAEIVNAPEWEAGHSYITGWLVRHNGALYRAQTETTGQPPDQHPDIWEHLGQYSSVAGIAAAALESATTNASDLAAEAARINTLVARMPGGSGTLATQASVSQEQSARIDGDAANAGAITVEASRIDGVMARMPAGTGKVAAEAALVSEQTARVSGDAANTAAISVEASRVDGLLARMPAGSGKAAAEASVVAEQNARIAGDAANASQIQVINSSLADKADAAAVSSINTRVEGLESAGSNSNLLSNTTFNSGPRLWFKWQDNSTWTSLEVNQSGDNYHPPGINSIGIKCPNSTLADNTQRAQIHSAAIPIVPGHRYIASCYIANHRCVARLFIRWENAGGTWIATSSSGVLARKVGGLTGLDNWHHAVAAGTAPANAARAKLVVEFLGDGGENPSGWILRPMLEQARETQTEPSPWNPGGMETSAQLLIESERTDALFARMPTGTGKVASEAALVSEQTARVSGDAANTAAISVEASRVDGLLARMPAGTGKAAAEASVVAEQNARIAGDAANASQIQAVSAAVDGKASASVVQSMQTRVEGLEAAGSNPNLLVNTTFNSGVQPWTRINDNSTWTEPAVDLGGATRQPPGMHSLGIRCTSGALNNTQQGRISSPHAAIAAVPGQRYMASVYLSSHRCKSRLILSWYDANKASIFNVFAPLLGRKEGGTALSNWHHAIVSGIAPANAAYVRVQVLFVGDGGTDAYGWILRPMLEQATATQTEPSPWNPGGMETSAEYTLAVQANGLVAGLRAHSDGAVAGLDILATIFRILSPSGAPNGLELRDGTLRVWRGNAQRIIGNGFGPNGDLMDYFGPNVGVNNASKSNAKMWMDIHGNAWWGGDITAGPLKYSAQSHSTQTIGLELINGPFPTNGGLRTVHISFSRFVESIKYAHGGGISLGAGSNTATISIYRKIGNAAEALWQTITATGSCSFINEGDGDSIAWANWFGEKTVVDTSPSTATVRYRVVISAFTAQAIHVTGTGFNKVITNQSLKIDSVEGAQ